MKAIIESNGALKVASAPDHAPVPLRCPFQSRNHSLVRCNRFCAMFDLQAVSDGTGTIYLRCGTGRTLKCDRITVEPLDAKGEPA